MKPDMEKLFFNPAEITQGFIDVGIKKSKLPIYKMLLLGMLAGAFIAFASEGSNAAIHTIASVGLGKALAGALFATGLMLVIIAGGELFTGNCLFAKTNPQFVAEAAKLGVTPEKLAGLNWGSFVTKNLLPVTLGNIVGGVVLVGIVYWLSYMWNDKTVENRGQA